MRIGKKGSVIDLFYIIVMFLIVGIMFVVAVYLKDAMFTPLKEIMGSSSGFNTTITTVEAGFSTLDWLFLLLFFMMNGTIIILAALVPSHPVFLAINIILLLILFIVSPSISNIMNSFWSTPEFAVYASGGGGSVTFSVMTKIFQYLPIITLVISIAVTVVTYTKGQDGF